jgi:hypothetical protein
LVWGSRLVKLPSEGIASGSTAKSPFNLTQRIIQIILSCYTVVYCRTGLFMKACLPQNFMHTSKICINCTYLYLALPYFKFCFQRHGRCT